MAHEEQFDAEVNGIMIEYAELVASFDKLMADYAKATTDEERSFINYAIEDYKRQLTILKQRIAAAKLNKTR